MASYLRPTSLDEALAALADRPRTMLAGGTDIYPARVGRWVGDDILDVTALPELRAIVVTDDVIRIPALATWTDVIRADLPPAFDGLKAAARAVGGVQIQHRGTVAGNLCNASPAADGLPNLMALDARVELVSAAGRREVPVGEFVVGNRRTIRRPDELVTAVLVPRPGSSARSAFLKLGSRAYLVISIAMVAVVVELGDDGADLDEHGSWWAPVPRCRSGSVGPRRDWSVGCRRRRSPTRSSRPTWPASARSTTFVRPAAYRRDAALTLVRRAVAQVLA